MVGLVLYALNSSQTKHECIMHFTHCSVDTLDILDLKSLMYEMYYERVSFITQYPIIPTDTSYQR